MSKTISFKLNGQQHQLIEEVLTRLRTAGYQIGDLHSFAKTSLLETVALIIENSEKKAEQPNETSQADNQESGGDVQASQPQEVQSPEQAGN